MSENHPVQHPLPAGVNDNFTYACNTCGGTVTVVASTRQPHTCVTAERDALRGTLSNTICNAGLYPSRAVPYLLGGDMSGVLDRTTDAILAAGYKNYRTFAGSGVLLEVADERVRQTDKWGEQNHPNGTGPSKLPMPYGSGSWSAAVAAESLKLITECASQIGQCTWLHILREEVFEAFAEKDPAKLRAELIQVAAVAVQWVEAIDRGKQ